MRVLQNLELEARKQANNSKARKLNGLAKRIKRGKANQGDIAKHMHGVDKEWQIVKDLDGDDAWRRGLAEVDAILSAIRSIDDYKQLLSSMRELQHLLQDIGDKGTAKKIKKLERKMAKPVDKRRTMKSRKLDDLSEKVRQVLMSSSKLKKQHKLVKKLQQGSEEVQSGLADSGLLRPKQALQRNLSTLEDVLLKLDEKETLGVLRELQADIAAKRLSREEIDSALATLNKALRDGERAKAFDLWQTNLTEVKAKLNGGKVYELNPDLTAVWDDMILVLEHSTLRKTFVERVRELQRSTLGGKLQDKTLASQLEQLDTKVRQKTGGFRTADELNAVQGKERRAAQRELSQRIAQLRTERRKEIKHIMSELDAPLREGEKVRKAKQGRFTWFNYGNGGERIVDREQVLDTLRNGGKPHAIEVRAGLEKLAAQLTGVATFVALPFVLADDKPQAEQVLPLLQHIAEEVDARVTPTASCFLEKCVAED